MSEKDFTQDEIESEQPLNLGELFAFTKGNYKITINQHILYVNLRENDYFEIQRMEEN